MGPLTQQIKGTSRGSYCEVAVSGMHSTDRRPFLPLSRIEADGK